MKGIINSPDEITANAISAGALLLEGFDRTFTEKEIERIHESIHELWELSKDLKKDLKWALGELNLKYYQKWPKAENMAIKYKDLLEDK